MLVRRLGSEIYRVGGTLLGWALWVSLTVVWGIAIVPLTLLLRPLWPGVVERFVALTRGTLDWYVHHLSFLRLVVENAEKRLEGPRVLVVNHQSRLDSPALLAIEPDLRGPVRGYMLRMPLLGSAIRLMGFFDADAGESAVLDAMSRAAEQARTSGGGLLFYPEGTRSENGEIGSFRRGAFRTAVDHDLPIQPVVIDGMDAVLPPKRLISPESGRYTVRIRYLEPLHPPYGRGHRRDVVRVLTEQVRTTIADELERMRADREKADFGS